MELWGWYTARSIGFSVKFGGRKLVSIGLCRKFRWARLKIKIPLPYGGPIVRRAWQIGWLCVHYRRDQLELK